MWESHQRYGKLKWAELIEPVIEICANGYNITAANAKAINSVEKYIRDPAFNLWFVLFSYNLKNYVFADLREIILANNSYG